MLLSGLVLLALALPPKASAAINPSAANTTLPSSSSVTATIYPPTANGQPIGITGSSVLGMDVFLGIPYAEPVIGEHRWDRPTPKIYTGNITALTTPPMCMQIPPASQVGYIPSEDCLHLNVLAPQGAVGSDHKLPVMVWIHGGGFVQGVSALYNSPIFVNYAAASGRPTILVTVNYRLGIWGFPYGKELYDAGAANLGLRDQILALQWVKENIASFGGDPGKVTVFGESAGSISVSLHMLNETTDMFRGAVMQSGAQSTAMIGPADSTWEESFQAFAQATGVSCLKAFPADALLNATIAVRQMPQFAFANIWAPSIDGDLIPDRPVTLIAAGKFAHIPYITGNVKDEGTAYFPPDIGDTPIELSLSGAYPSPRHPAVIQAVLDKYPDDPALGSPFDTGNETWGLSPTFKRGAAIAGDSAFQSRRRWFIRNSNTHGLTETWNYLFNGSSPNTPPFLGVPHASDVPYTFGLVSPELNYTVADVELSRALMNYCHAHGKKISGPAPLNAMYWEPYGYPAAKNTLRMMPSRFDTIQDDYREEQMAVFNEPEVSQQLMFRRGE